jgi:hypothetical protein
MALFKDIYTQDFYQLLADYFVRYLPSFDQRKLIDQILIPEFASMEWKERVKHTTKVIHEFLPNDYAKASGIIVKVASDMRTDYGSDSLTFIIFPDYIESYGLDDLETSIKAFQNLTQLITCEFSVRPFIIKYGDKMMGQMLCLVSSLIMTETILQKLLDWSKMKI